ncbi:Ger(x)C family spore germination protein [Paenibacillus sp. PL91]|uniref:Ger(x)C family spore germination protein n=1 Tax=Paenibacillus sp. PL91 TaxID=2729538 RepID=UPI00145C3A88|nr:Ger(x)C family spore germination protein [Paenibacillus sp. PL91]MBC9203907.1 Ger(x)C family spore germination protein [Paenibacillus sp. PL91]
MKKGFFCLSLLLGLFIVSGCWSKFELTERGFVMGVALDQGEDGKIELLTQIYRPTSTQTVSSVSTITSSINIKTSDDSVMEAIRDIPIHLGRKAQWSHLRVIIVGEKLARSNNLGHLLDLFYRDHEPRSSVSLMISKGTAGKLFEKKPLIEQTTAQQFLRAKESSHITSAKTVDNNLLDLMLQLRSASGDAIVSYVYEDKNSKDIFSAAGLALLKKGKMKVVLPASKVEGLLMLRNAYQSGVVEIKCPGKNGEHETAEILSLKVKTKPRIQGDEISASSTLVGDIAIGELKCSDINSAKAEMAFIKKVEEKLSKQIKNSFQFLQSNKMDVIGIADAIYRSDPRKWEDLKRNWDTQFSELPFTIKVRLKLITSGTISSKPAG